MQGQLIFPKTSRPAVGPPCILVPLRTGVISLGVKWPICVKVTTNLSNSFCFFPSKHVYSYRLPPTTPLPQCLLYLLSQTPLHFVRIGRKWRRGSQYLVSTFGRVGGIFWGINAQLATLQSSKPNTCGHGLRLCDVPRCDGWCCVMLS